jgi:hypothetical protein
LGYQVNAAENSRYREESERRVVGVYEGVEEALSACRYVIDRSLRDLHEGEMQAAQLFLLWAVMGEDAWLVPLTEGEPEPAFSGQDYARMRSEDICLGR